MSLYTTASAVLRTSSRDLSEAKRKSLFMLRIVQRAVPKIMDIYQLDMPQAWVRRCISDHWRKNSLIDNPKVIDVLLWRADEEFCDTMGHFKQRTHVERLLQSSLSGNPSLTGVSGGRKASLADIL